MAGAPGPQEYRAFREFVYGLDYIDEPVAVFYPQADGCGETCRQYVIQDANFNVIAYVETQSGSDLECEYDPYGRMRVGDNTGQWQEDAEYYPSTVSSWADPMGMHGLWFDRETGCYYARGRYYCPQLCRFTSQDPNGTGLALTSGMRYNGQAPSVSTPAGTAMARKTPGVSKLTLERPRMGA